MPVIRWIKITTDMFDDEKVKLIEKMPEADSLLIIWVKLICYAGKVNDQGNIYLTPKIALNDESLSTILNRPINVVRLALDTFHKLDMIEISDAGNIYLVNWWRHQNIDTLDKIREQGRARIGRFREKQKLLAQACNVTVTYRNAGEGEREGDRDREVEGENTLEKLLEEKRYDEILITSAVGTTSLSTIIRYLKGEHPCHPTTLRIYKEELSKLKIDLASLGINNNEEG